MDYTGGKNLAKEAKSKGFQAHHEFVCDCVACVNNWPVLTQYPTIQYHVNTMTINMFIK